MKAIWEFLCTILEIVLSLKLLQKFKNLPNRKVKNDSDFFL